MNWLRLSCLSLLGLLLVSVVWSCGGNKADDTFGNNGSSSSGSSGGHNGADGSTSSSGGFGDGSVVGFGEGGPNQPEASTGCTNLQCQIHSCSGQAADGGNTEITGQVFDPAGNNPLYNVVVYIPNSQGGALDTIPIGVNANSCSCDALFSGSPIAVATTDADGKFTLTNAPDGANIPLVVQIGKWRKEITIPTVTQCSSTNAGKITLPKNLKDGAYASIPNIAVSTGGADTLECLLTRVGVDEAFFTGQTTGPGIHVFQGAGGNAAAGSQSSPAALWNSQNDLMQYDIVMLSCEGSPTTGVTATTASYLAPYVSAGGRVFAEHYHYAFFVDSANSTDWPQFANVANWVNIGLTGNDEPYNNDITGIIETTLANGKPFPEGAALKTWLGNVGALNASNEIVVPEENARDDATVTASNLATAWVQTDPSVSPASTQYFSWDMPFNPPDNDAGVPEYCGRVVYSDMHVSGSANDYETSQTVPTGCDSTSALSPDEKAIEFILFDLSSCIVPIGFTPQPPPPQEGGIAQ